MRAVPDPTDAAPIAIDSLLRIDFSASGNSAPYLGAGWGAPEPRMAWTLGPRAVLRLPAPWEARQHLLDLDVEPCRLAPLVRGQTLGVRINGRDFGEHLLLERTTLRCHLPADLWRDRPVIDIAFALPNFLVPRRLHWFPDPRPLGVAFFAATLYSPHEAPADLALPTLPPPAPQPLLHAAPQPLAKMLPTPPEARAELYPFGIRQRGSDLAGEGWSAPEQRFQWTSAPYATLRLPAPATPGPYLLRLTCTAFTHAPALPAQELSISVDGRVLAHLQAAHKSTFALPLPAGPGTGLLQVGLHVPTAARPVDLGAGTDRRQLGVCLFSAATEPLPPALAGWAGQRVDEIVPPEGLERADRFCAVADADLPAAVEAELGLTPAALLRDFESLGENCEFGIAQRKLGCEVLGLFRFGFTPVDSLLRGFADDFAALADLDAVTIAPGGGKPPEFVLSVDAYKMRWHTFVPLATGDADTTRRDHGRRLGFVRRKFLETLRASRKIFVLKRERPLTLAEVLPVLQEINRSGQNTLLYIVPGAPPERHGLVERVGPGLLRGYIARFAVDADVITATAEYDWLRLCANAWTLRDQAALPAPVEPAAPTPPPPVQPVTLPAGERFCAVSDDDLPVRVIAGLGLTPAELLRDFESLGDNCEFGIAQRKLDVEVLGLFRFGFTTLDNLLRGFADDFAALADPDAATLAPDHGRQPEFLLSVPAYGLRWHTFVPVAGADPDAVRREQARKLGFVRRKFLETLAAARKIFVVKRERALAAEEVAPLLAQLNRTGRNTLLYVVPGASPDRNGRVVWQAPGLLRGEIAGFAPEADVMTATNENDWLRLCANAFDLHAHGVVPAVLAAASPPPALSATQLRLCESLGDTAEFGDVQRGGGMASLSLFGDAELPLAGLLAGLAEDFAGIEERAGFAVAPSGRLTLARYAASWKLPAPVEDAERVLQRQIAKLGYLRRRFLDGLRAGGRLYVLRRTAPLTFDDIRPVAEALRRHGRHTLLYVVPSPGAAGQVERVATGVLCGHLPAPAADGEAWLPLLANAWTLHDAQPTAREAAA